MTDLELEYGRQVDQLRAQLQAAAAQLSAQQAAALHTADLLIEARQRANDLRAGMYGLLGLALPGPMEYRIHATNAGSGALQIASKPALPDHMRRCQEYLDYLTLPQGGTAVRHGILT